MFRANESHLPGGFYVHASSVIVPGGALLFLGKSGAGKSTISKLLEKEFPVLADDIVYLATSKNGTWKVSDGMPLLTSHLGQRRYDNGTVPLRAVVRITKSNVAELTPLGPLEICHWLIRSVFEIPEQRAKCKDSLIRQWFSYTADIARRYRGYNLNFTCNGKTLNSIKHHFYIASIQNSEK